MILFQWILHTLQSRLFTKSPRSTTRPLYFWCFASNSAFFRWQMSINDAKNVQFCPHSLLQRPPHFCFWLASIFSIFPSLREFHGVILDFLGTWNTILIIHFPNNVIGHWHKDDPVLELFGLKVLSRQVFLGLLKNRQWWKYWEIFSSRIQSLLHRFPLLLGKTNATWVLPLDLSIFLSLPQMSISVARWIFFFVSLCFQINLLFALDFVQIPCWDCLELYPFVVHCGFCIRNVHHLWRRNKLMYQVIMWHRSKSFACNVVFMIFGRKRFHSLPCGFRRIHSSTINCFGNSSRMLFPTSQHSWCHLEICYKAWLVPQVFPVVSGCLGILRHPDR